MFSAIRCTLMMLSQRPSPPPKGSTMKRMLLGALALATMCIAFAFPVAAGPLGFTAGDPIAPPAITMTATGHAVAGIPLADPLFLPAADVCIMTPAPRSLVVPRKAKIVAVLVSHPADVAPRRYDPGWRL